MFRSCPHCHELVSIAPGATPPAARCPRCGGDLPAAAGDDGPPPVAAADGGREAPGRAAPSIASLLQARAIAGDQDLATGDRAEADAAGEAATSDPGPFIDQAQAPEAIAGSPRIADANDGPGHVHREQREGAERVADAMPAVQPDPTPDAVAGAGPEAVATTAAPAPGPSMADPGALGAPPSFTLGTNLVHARTPAWQWLAIALLAMLLVLQVLLADRARLASDPAWRPAMVGLCGVLGCTLPTWRDPSAFTMLSRDVRPLPGVAGALQVQATFRNEARWPQAWPVMVVSLADADGRVLGARAFSPGEYLEDSSQSELAPGQSAHVMLHVREPDPAVVAFAFDFR